MTTGIPAAGAHEHWNDRLSLYLDGELESAERARLETHVAECAACASCGACGAAPFRAPDSGGLKPAAPP